MERLNFRLLTKKFRGSFGVLARPDVVWRMILGTVVFIVLCLSVAGWITYGWASHPSIPATSTKKSVTVTKEELRATIEQYKSKQLRFESLRLQHPPAPILESGHGVESTGNLEDTQVETAVEPLEISPDKMPQ